MTDVTTNTSRTENNAPVAGRKIVWLNEKKYNPSGAPYPRGNALWFHGHVEQKDVMAFIRENNIPAPKGYAWKWPTYWRVETRHHPLTRKKEIVALKDWEPGGRPVTIVCPEPIQEKPGQQNFWED